MSAPYVPAFTFTDDERAAQDARLNPIIAELWKAGGITWWRNGPEFQAAHQRWLTMFSAADVRVIPDYLNTVLAMATTAAGPFVPVDLWPSVPRPAAVSLKGHLAFQVVTNTIREGAGVFTLGKLRRNKHYGLLVAHMLCWPEPIEDASQILEPGYPWPFIIKVDEEGTPRLERQEDIRGEQWDIAQRIETALFEDARQVDRLPHGASHTAKSRRDMKVERRLFAGEIANRLYDTIPPEAIAKHAAFKAALMTDDGPAIGRIASGDGVRKLIRLYREAHNLPPLPRGRPPKRA